MKAWQEEQGLGTGSREDPLIKDYLNCLTSSTIMMGHKILRAFEGNKSMIQLYTSFINPKRQFIIYQ